MMTVDNAFILSLGTLGGMLVGFGLDRVMTNAKIRHLEDENRVLFGNFTDLLKERHVESHMGPKRDANGRFTR